MANTSERMFLYKAAKHEVTNYKEDCGMNLAEMWAAISKKPEQMTRNDKFWLATCIEDYNNR